jgi:hypothetical protein
MENRISLKSLNIFYLIGVLIFLTAGNYVQALHFEIGLLITEYVFVLGFGLFIIKANRANISDYIHFGDVRRRDLFKTIMIVLFSLPIVMTLNLIMVYILELFDLGIAYQLPVSTEFSGLIFQFFIVSVSAGICEEVLFRGVILNTYSDYYSYKHAIVISALLFGLYHFNIENILGPIYLGLVFGYLAVKTKSIVPAILGHMTNNGVAYLLAMMGSMIEVDEAEVEMAMSADALFDTILSLSVLAIFCFGIVLYLLKTFKDVPLDEKGPKAGQAKMAYYIPIAITIVIYIGYTAFILAG